MPHRIHMWYSSLSLGITAEGQCEVLTARNEYYHYCIGKIDFIVVNDVIKLFEKLFSQGGSNVHPKGFGSDLSVVGNRMERQEDGFGAGC
ncbi:hypothetical protein EJ08DRAFT_654049 [Tothia fuscella]|uniref:Uncharacterized protein n=1 Tax=Tothia fuscella TaxID=1048955 RepID=A0A9P4TSU3_9PEZI|nr:hypothetical protein EJ08DRAFT_654049 [Tothia fuscella]